MKVEVNAQLAFVDTMVISMNNGELCTKWCQKPTSSGRLLNFNSYHPLTQKSRVVLGLLYRVLMLSHPSFHEENLKEVRCILESNNYPKSFVDICLRKFRDHHLNGEKRMSKNSQENRFRFPFVKGLSRGISLSFRGTDWKPAFYNIRKIGDIYSRVKDKTPLSNISEVIYKTPCSCNNLHIGQTK